MERALANVCVFCASSPHVDQVYRDAARELGRLLGEGGHTLVYGGTRNGLMGVLAGAVHAAGGRVVGVIPTRMLDHDIAYREADDLLVAETMAERKGEMEKRADAFVALPGGFGTLEELCEVITLKQLLYVSGPIVIVNVAGYYDRFLDHLEYMYETGFAYAVYRALYCTVSTPQEALAYIESYSGDADLPEKWKPPS